MPRIRQALVAALVLVLVPAGVNCVRAQDTLHLKPGARVRVIVDSTVVTHGAWGDVSSHARYVGELVAQRPDSLQLRLPPDSIISLAVSRVIRLEVSRGRHSSAGKGALIGGGIGAALGLAVGIGAASESCTGFCPPRVSGGEIAGVTLITGFLGAFIGAIIGAPSREGWEPVSIEHAVRPELRVGGGRVGIGVAVGL